MPMRNAAVTAAALRATGLPGGSPAAAAAARQPANLIVMRL